MFNVKNGCVRVPSGEMDYIRFGSGARTLVLLPGVGDGLKTVKGMALPFALMYRKLTRDFTVYGFSRCRDLPAHKTTREMAQDLALAMDAMGLADAAVGDVIQLGSGSRVYHSLLVTAVRSGMPYVAQHTFAAFDRPLDSYSYEKARCINIIGARRYG